MNFKRKILSLLEQITNENELAHIYITVSNSITIQRHTYNEWFSNQTDAITDLHIKVLMLEKYFDDMLLDKMSIMGKYLETSLEGYANDTEGLSLDAHYYRLCISDNTEKYDGTFDKCNRIITIKKACVNNQNVILHEMLHANEEIINSINPIIRDVLIVELYKKLKMQLANLDEIIYVHSNIPHILELSEVGGDHSLLFMLKSLDLDLRCGNDLFTVFGYDYNRYFKELNLI